MDLCPSQSWDSQSSLQVVKPEAITEQVSQRSLSMQGEQLWERTLNSSRDAWQVCDHKLHV